MKGTQGSPEAQGGTGCGSACLEGSQPEPGVWEALVLSGRALLSLAVEKLNLHNFICATASGDRQGARYPTGRGGPGGGVSNLSDAYLNCQVHSGLAVVDNQLLSQA